jgi:exopolysaccharide biosynthesis WecB/TagA/CpsF family protein
MIFMGKEISDLIEKKDAFGVPCTVVDTKSQENIITEWIKYSVSGKIITFLNPHVYNYSFLSEAVNYVLQKADIVSLDGSGIKCLLFLKYGKLFPRTIMTYLFENIAFSDSGLCTAAILIGTSEKEVNLARTFINNNSNSIFILKAYHGFYTNEFYIKELEKLPDVRLILIGMGAPRSEELIIELWNANSKRIFWHIGGGTIKCMARTKRRAPRWISNIGMEWLHRMIYESQHLNRYILGLPFFIFNLIRHKKVKSNKLL